MAAGSDGGREAASGSLFEQWMAGLGDRDVESEHPYPGFDVKGQLGQGGFAAVYLAREYDARRDVALKTPAAEPGLRDATRLRRFLDEAAITAQLQHPGIVPVYRLGQDAGGFPY